MRHVGWQPRPKALLSDLADLILRAIAGGDDDRLVATAIVAGESGADAEHGREHRTTDQPVETIVGPILETRLPADIRARQIVEQDRRSVREDQSLI